MRVLTIGVWSLSRTTGRVDVVKQLVEAGKVDSTTQQSAFRQACSDGYVIFAGKLHCQY